ncbi:hypothetical protein P0Y35_09020 [Kiritimatiellaeota bacterium B1221]|nr:hypothetical protein [Kiritimatiellaeota bacterium B1221]
MKNTLQKSLPYLKYLSLILAGVSMLTACGPGPTESRFIEEGLRVGEAIGKVLQENHPDIQIVVMTRPGLAYNPLVSSEESILEGLKNTFSGSIVLAELEPDARQNDGIQAKGDISKEDVRKNWYKSYSQWYNLDNLKAFMDAQTGKADLILCMPGFPGDLSLENFPQSPGTPALAALNMRPEQALTFLENGKGWIYQAVRPEQSPSPKPGLEIQEVGAHSIILYPARDTL